MATVNQKNQARVIQVRLNELGFDVKLGQAYQVIAALEGDKSWNVTSGKSENNPKGSIEGSGSKTYDVVLEALGVLRFPLQIKANSEEEASVAAKKLLLDDATPWSVEKLAYPQVNSVMDKETGSGTQTLFPVESILQMLIKSTEKLDQEKQVTFDIIEDHPMEGARVVKSLSGSKRDCEEEAGSFLMGLYSDKPDFGETDWTLPIDQLITKINAYEEDGSERFFSVDVTGN